MSGPITYGLPRINYPVNIPVSYIQATASPVLFGRYSVGAGGGEQIALSSPFSVTGGTLSIQAGAQYELLGRSAAGAGPMSSVSRTAMNIPGLELGNVFSVAQTIRANTITPTPIADTLLQLVGADATTPRILIDAFGAGTQITSRRANGTSAAPSNLINNSVMTSISSFGYGATGYSATARAQYQFLANETWTDAAQGSKFGMTLTPAGTIVPATVLSIDQTNGASFFTATPAQVSIDPNRGLRRRAFTFATLPAAATSQDSEFVITDGAAAPVWLAAAAGGGAVRTPVISNGAAYVNG